MDIYLKYYGAYYEEKIGPKYISYRRLNTGKYIFAGGLI